MMVTHSSSVGTWYEPPREPDAGVFYVRVWPSGSEQYTEKKFTSLAAANAALG